MGWEYSYCTKCDAGMAEPTPQEDLIDGQACPNCGRKYLNQLSIEEWIITLYNEIEKLKFKEKDVR